MTEDDITTLCREGDARTDDGDDCVCDKLLIDMVSEPTDWVADRGTIDVDGWMVSFTMEVCRAGIEVM